ncbi:hypothetical protein Dimus_030180 [Dionaea muscipula]
MKAVDCNLLVGRGFGFDGNWGERPKEGTFHIMIKALDCHATAISRVWFGRQATYDLRLLSPYRDEDGEPLIDYDDMRSDEEQPRDDVVDYNDLQVDNYNDGGCGDWQELRSPTPIYNGAEGSDPRSKGRKRLVKKSNKSSSIPPELNDFEDDDVGVGGFGRDPASLVRDESDEGRYSSGLLKRKIKGVKDGSERRR